MAVRVVILLILFAVAGCAQPDEPNGPQALDGRFGAPLPSAPRDVRSLSTDPCAALASSEWQELGFQSEGTFVTLPTGERSCEWRGPGGSPYVNLGIAADRDILVDTYRVRQLAVFRPAMITGLPATIEQTTNESISCNVTVGTAQDQGFLIIYDADLGIDGRPADPCGRAWDIAERIVAALPPLPGK